MGTGVDFEEVRAYAKELHIPNEFTQWKGELTPQQVAEEFDKADLFVLPSHYENAPVVISESLAKGVPVISTRVGGIPEMVKEECGILVTPGNDEELVEALEKMLDHYQEYNREQIRSYGQQYSFATVGKRLKTFYEESMATTA